jgi:Flp pilus assembly protein TadD
MFRLLVVLAVGVLCFASEVRSAPMLAPTPETAKDPADVEYEAGLQAKAAKRYAVAAASFRRAVDARPRFPAAWNELGFALRQTGKYDEALQAYDQALKLQPNFPEAMEYLGEAYVKLGRLDDARAILARLKPLDAGRAAELDQAIRAGR